eukprot:scaffold230930_cov33-Tisochrysis_lutea.AAC.12
MALRAASATPDPRGRMSKINAVFCQSAMKAATPRPPFPVLGRKRGQRLKLVQFESLVCRATWHAPMDTTTVAECHNGTQQRGIRRMVDRLDIRHFKPARGVP